MSTNDLNKWRWKMDYCKDNNIPPAQEWAWSEAEDAYRKRVLNSEKAS